MKCVSDRLVLSVLFAIYDLTSMNDNSYASLKQICDITDLSLDTVESIAEESLSQFCIVSKDKSYRIKGEYMNIPPILSILHPSIDIFKAKRHILSSIEGIMCLYFLIISSCLYHCLLAS